MAGMFVAASAGRGGPPRPVLLLLSHDGTLCEVIRRLP